MQKYVFFIFVLMIFCNGVPVKAEDAVNIYETPRMLPKHDIIHQSGARYLLSDFKGEFVLAVFWSRNCGPCIAELKSLNEFSNLMQNKDVKLLLISEHDEWGSVDEQKRFLKKYGAADIEFYVDEYGKVASDLGIFTSPHTVLINTKGEEIGRIRGSADWASDEVVEYILKLKDKYG